MAIKKTATIPDYSYLRLFYFLLSVDFQNPQKNPVIVRCSKTIFGYQLLQIKLVYCCYFF